MAIIGQISIKTVDLVGSNPYSKHMATPQILVYCAVNGDFVLSVRGRPETWTFKAIENAVTAARNLHKHASLIVYSAVGQVVLETVT